MIPLIFFLMFVASAVVFDLGILNRKAHAPTVKEAALWSLGWIGLACVFGAGVWIVQGAHAGSAWFTAYVMEKALSVDNLFVFSLIFTYFHIPAKYQHKVLAWGIIGAAVLRMLMIGAGVELVATFHWVLYGFGAFLLYAGIKLLWSDDDAPDDVEESLAVRLAKKLLPYKETRIVSRFFVRELITVKGIKPFYKTYATRLLLCLVAIEIADVMFAVDSVPVVVSLTQDVFLAFTSNIMAILGLRALFFLLQHLLSHLRFLQVGLGTILSFIGLKMLAADVFPITSGQSLAVVGGILFVTVVASVVLKDKP